MIWQYILLSVSAVLFFGFVVLCVKKFGLLSCYSAYGAKWMPEYASQINWWSMVTIGSALLLVPVLLEGSEDSMFQFTGFLAPVFITLVGATPNYQENKQAFWTHQIGAWGTVLFVSVYAFVIPHLLWIILALLVVMLVVSLFTGIKQTWMFWAEMAMYISTYLILFIMV